MRGIRRVLVLILAITLTISLFPVSTVLAADDVSAQTNVTTSELTIKTAGGVIINPDASGNYTNVPKDVRVFIEYAFDLLDDNGLDFGDSGYQEYNYTAGDYIVVQLPYAVLFEAPPGGWDVVAEGTSDVIGVLSIDSSGVATIVFTDYVETHSSVRGWFSLEGNFKDGTFSEGDPVEVDIEFDGTIINISFEEDPSELEISCDKEGVFDPDTNEITWTITVTPNMQAEEVVVTDTFSSNQTFVSGSFTAGGVSVSDAELDFTVGSSSTSFDYSAGTMGSETVFTYKTTPTATAFNAETGSSEYVSFTNDAQVFSEDEEFADDNAVVSFNWIQKNGSVAGTSAEDLRIINWTINVNYQEYDFNGVIITDNIPEGLELLDDATYDVSFGGTPLTLDVSMNPGTYTFDSPTNTLVAYVGDISSQQALTFSTRVTDDNIFTQNGTERFTNSSQMTWTGNISGIPSDNSGVNVGRGVISKSAGSRVNYLHSRDNIITWTMQINANQISITDAVISDTILAGLEYVEDSFTINDPHDTLPDTFKGTFNYNAGTRELSYEFGESRTIDTQFTATFETRITDYTILYVNQDNIAINNSVIFTGVGLTDGEQTDSGSQRFNSQVIQKEVLSGYDYSTKRVQWRVVVNRNEIPMYNAVLTDSIPAGMSFLPDTFEVTPSDAGTDTGEALQYTLYPQSDTTSQDSFTFTFDETLSEQVTITYETQVKEALLLTQGEKSFSNTAELTADDLSASSTASASMNNYMVKKDLDYITGADYIEWAIVVNAQAISLTDIEASDILQEGLLPDMDSVAMYPMTIAADGSLTKQSTPIPQNQYSVTYDETTRELKLTMPGTHSTPYQLEFITDVLEDSMTVNNTVVFSGQSYTASSIIEGAVIEVDESGLGGTGMQGSITIEKVDPSDVPLQGAVFTLYNNRGELVAQDTTDQNGRIVFGSLPIRTYVLEETSAPAGYIKSEETVRFRMNTEAPNEFFRFENEEEIRGQVTIEKVNATNNTLQGAVFTLYDSLGEIVTQGTTDENGRVVFADLPEGIYVLKETSPPAGYIRSEETITIRIEEPSQEEFYQFVNEHENPQTGERYLSVYRIATALGMLMVVLAVLILLKAKIHRVQ